MTSRVPALRVVVLLAVLAAVGGAAWLVRGRATPTRVFCGADGRLTATAPLQSHRSYCLRAFTPVTHLRPGDPIDFGFDIVDDRGATVRQFEIVHEKRMHVIVVRHDLAHFQHVHPTFSVASGRFDIHDLVLPTAGAYRLFADFTPVGSFRGPEGEPLGVTVPIDLEVGDLRLPAADPVPQPSDTARVGGYEVVLSRPDSLRAGEMARLTVTIHRGGAIVTDLEPYLGANGHAVLLREGDLAFIHSHALVDPVALRAGTLPFMVEFGEPGAYRMFVQFQHLGVVQTATLALQPTWRGAQ